MNRQTFRQSIGVALLALAPFASAWAQGIIAGRVTDQQTNQPVASARVTVLGTTTAVVTNSEGRYTLANVRPGQVTIKIAALGYAAVTRPVTVTAGAVTEENVVLVAQAFSLDEIVVTATGEQEKRAMGNQVTTIKTDSLVMRAPANDINDLLTSRTPGVSVFESPITGAEARVRIRGANSLSLSNEPIYYIDGIRMEAATGSSSIGIGGTNPSRLNDLNPEEIESIEIVKGPSAATLYGTDAVNGVVVIRTKRGQAGPPRWNVYTEAGVISDHNTWPTAYRGWRTGPTAATNSLATNGVQCLLTQVAAGACAQDSVSHYNLFEDPAVTPIGTGYRGQVGAQVSGGTESVRYFLSGEYEDEIGLLKSGSLGWDRFVNRWQVGAMPYDYYRPNARNRTALRANVNANLSPKWDVAISTGFMSSEQRLPQTDNNTTGLLSNAFGGPGHADNWRFSPDTIVLHGFRAFTPDEMFAEVVSQNVNRFIGSGTMSWHPNTWLTGRAIAGVDFTSRLDKAICKQFECTPFGTDTLGRVEDNRTGFHDYTFDANLAAHYPLRADIRGTTTVGVQFVHNEFERNGAFGLGLAPGATSLANGAAQQNVSEATTRTKTLGVFVEQQVALRDRLFVTAALRADDNSAFGQDFKAAKYPKFGVSYVISEESYFPKPSWLTNLRLRGAIGYSGQQPGSTDAVPFYSPTIAASEGGTDKPAIIFSSSGNPDLKPERAREIELGFDATMLDSRLNVQLTYYHKRAKDALIARVLPPSVGANTTRFENLGSVRNSGIEVQVSAILLNDPKLGWDVTVGGFHNSNVIEDLGGVPPIVGTTIQQREGYPVDGYWQRPILAYNDLNRDGMIEAWEVVVGDTAVFVGPSLAPTEFTLNTGVDLLRRKLRISALFDYKRGRMQLNGTERIRCESRLNCDAEIDRNTPLWKQARVVALRDHAARTQYGFFEPADGVRLRELSMSYNLPEPVSRLFRASQGLLTVAARNVHRWTKYSGLDPESGYSDGGLQTDFQTQPPPMYFIVRMNLTY